MLLLKFIKAT